MAGRSVSRRRAPSGVSRWRAGARLLAVALGCGCIAQGATAAAELGATAPPIAAKLLNGTRFRLAQQAGKVVILNFWATWCPPCRAEMPQLDAYYRAHRNDGLEIIAISMDAPEDLPKVREVMAAYSFPAAMIVDADVRGYGRIWRMPMTFVIDRHGILRRDSSEGDPKLDVPTLETTVTPLLAADPAPR